MASNEASPDIPTRVRVANTLRTSSPLLLILLGGSFTYLMYTTGRIAMAVPVTGVLLGGIVSWIVLRRSNVEEVLGAPTLARNQYLLFVTRPRITLSITSLYVAVTLVLYSNALYERPTIAYLLHGLLFAYLALFIIYRKNKVLTVVQLVPVAFVTYWSSQLVFPTGTGRTVSEARFPEAIFEAGGITSGMTYETTPGYYLLSGTFSQITGLSWLDGHLLIAVLIVTGPILVLASLDRVFPSISPEVAQLSALLYVTTAYTLARGITPHRTSFFYMHIALIGLLLFTLLFRRYRWQYLFAGLFIIASAVVGHTFSAGAPFVILFFAIPLVLVYLWTYRDRMMNRNFRIVSVFVAIYGVIFFGYEIFGRGATEVFSRAAGIITWLYSTTFGSGEDLGSSGGTTGGGYSQLPIDLLVQATLGEVLLFALTFAGIAVFAYSNRFDLDMLVLWIAGGFLVLFAAVFLVEGINAPRFYQSMVIFGMTVAMAVGLKSLTEVSLGHVGIGIFVVVVFAFATFSLMSPIAGGTMTPLSDEIPQEPVYDTAYHESNVEWNNKYVPEGDPSFQQMPLESIDSVTMQVNVTAFDEQEVYKYDQIYSGTGKRASGGSELGSAEFVFVEWNEEMEADNVIYSNGSVKSFKHNS